LEVTRAGVSRVFRVDSADQVLVPWPDVPLAAREAATVRVRLLGEVWSEWSGPASVEAGLLAPSDWQARFISPRTLGGIGAPAPILTADFDVPGEPVMARLYVTAQGIHQTTVNGMAVSADLFAPGWTSYHHRLRYQTYDVTALVSPGRNRVESLLGNGWFRGRLGWGGRRALYGDRLALLAQLEITLPDGSRTVVATDGSWGVYESAVISDDIYDGQTIDLRRSHTDSPPEPTDEVDELDLPLDRLVAPDGPPVRRSQTLPATRVWTSPAGSTLVDFGQNLVGWVKMRIAGHASGHEVVVRHAEVLENGELGVRPLRTAAATDRYILDGPADQVLQPTLTFHGFRYAQIDGVDSLDPADLEAIVVGSDLVRTGWFECSDPLVNRLHENVVWAMRGNFLDIPTDCPQRDERLGWTGDIQVFSPTASFLFDCAGFLSSWLKDLAVEQFPDGGVPFVVPDVLHDPAPAAAAWGDASTVVPWVLFQRFGDLEVLRRQFASMRAWVDRIAGLAGPTLLWTGGFQFGDWLDATAPPDKPFDAQVHPDIVATAHLIRSAQIVADAAQALGDLDMSRRYSTLAADARRAFADEYLSPNGLVVSDAPTAYAMAIAWGLLPDHAVQRAGDRLADLVRAAGFHITTGFVGTPLIADALTSTGHVDVAYRLLTQTSVPSWLYAVTMGATTVWERWDSMLPDGSINPGEMTSFNHYALGAVADWLHRTVAGLEPAAPGYRRVRVAPQPGLRFTSAAARHISPYGEIDVSWRRVEDDIILDLKVPVGVGAEVIPPNSSSAITVEHGAHSFRWTCGPATSEGAVTIRDLLDDEARWQAVVAATVTAGVAADEAAAASRLKAYLDSPSGELVQHLTARGMVAGGQELADLLSRS
jgi:alpha-L-rhamnosidase